MIDKITKRFRSMNVELFNPEELYFLLLALQEFEHYKSMIGDKGDKVFVSTLTNEDYD